MCGFHLEVTRATQSKGRCGQLGGTKHWQLTVVAYLNRVILLSPEGRDPVRAFAGKNSNLLHTCRFNSSRLVDSQGLKARLSPHSGASESTAHGQPVQV
jgi:hypothetical protein